MDEIFLPFEGRAYAPVLTMRNCCLAERELGIAIVVPGPDSIWTQPQVWQMAAWLYVSLRSVIPGLTLDRCIDEVLKPASLPILDKGLAQALDVLKPQLAELYGKKESPDPEPGPLAGSSTGEGSGVSAG